MNTTNKAMAQIFKEMGAIYEYMDDKFRAVAYHNASRVLESLEDDLSARAEKELAAMKGIGHGIAQKIMEYCQTGKIGKYDELKHQVPAEFIGLLEVKGFGPESLKRISKELKITTRDQLIKALKDGSIAKLKGFGKKKRVKMKKYYEQNNTRNRWQQGHRPCNMQTTGRAGTHRYHGLPRP